MAVLSHAAVEHGHGAGKKLDRDRLALCRTGAGRGIARKHLWPYPPGMARLDRDAFGHHGPGAAVAGQPAARTFDPQPLSLSRSAQPRAGGTAEGVPRPKFRRTGAARDSAHDQWDIGGAEE